MRVDQGSEFRFPQFRQEAEKRFNVIIEPAPRNHHEGVASAEVSMDARMRVAEGMLRRAEGLDTSYVVPAAKYAVYIRNLRFATHYRVNGKQVPRLTAVTKKQLNSVQLVPYLYHHGMNFSFTPQFFLHTLLQGDAHTSSMTHWVVCAP